MSLIADTRPEDIGIRTLLRDPNYLTFWFVGGLTGVLRWFQLLALGVYTFETTNSPLLVSTILRHAATYHGTTEIVSKTVEGPIHRYCGCCRWRFSDRLSARLPTG